DQAVEGLPAELPALRLDLRPAGAAVPQPYRADPEAGHRPADAVHRDAEQTRRHRDGRVLGPGRAGRLLRLPPPRPGPGPAAAAPALARAPTRRPRLAGPAGRSPAHRPAARTGTARASAAPATPPGAGVRPPVPAARPPGCGAAPGRGPRRCGRSAPTAAAPP